MPGFLSEFWILIDTIDAASSDDYSKSGPYSKGSDIRELNPSLTENGSCCKRVASSRTNSMSLPLLHDGLKYCWRGRDISIVRL
ncbi:uncharacterized protein BO96DRAFT_417262 [Aspergillus niger CBS 101883]|uniref:uncharacterized protein n=1 Tax=Aspergillus lacticoffeatus (strain CBS 101883) TaxID=1450533 RepID=UPI000D7EBA32|nr:uncharacterized protein BO96DRAFT_417262 [Aspergillus niger CBS 101883]PYH50104.1 hypothetical protein BO96DRAFT_417262 [Aspergillus niger CBS 101883]